MRTRIGELTCSYSARGIASFSVELWHDGLRKHRLIRDGNQDVIRRKVELQVADWDDRWAITSSRQQSTNERNTGKSVAAERTAEAQRELEQISNVLKHTLGVDDTIDWELLKVDFPFPEPKPTAAKRPLAPQPPVVPREPQQSDSASDILISKEITSSQVRRRGANRYPGKRSRWR